MKKYILPAVIASTLFLTNCSDFDKINVDPYSANENQVLPEYFLHNSILGAQQDPNIAERAFVLIWKTAARQHFADGISGGTDNDDWSSEYWKYASEWTTNVNTAIQMAEFKAGNGTAAPYNNNVMQVARIWRAYLMSEMSDIYGAMPIVAAQGKNPEFNSQKDVYYFMLAELKDAVSKIDINTKGPDAKFDLAYGYDWNKWIRYANSMRMRLAMRMSEVDPAKAKSEFEAAVATNMYISSSDQNFKVAEKTGWDALTGVMSREWNSQLLSATLNNMYVGLGGVKTADQLGADKQSAIKDEDYIGVKYDEQFSSKTNDPSAGYWFDGLPNKIDPRAYKTFFIPGDFNNPIYSLYPTYTSDAKTNFGELTFANGTKKTISTVNTWNGLSSGDWGAKGQKNGLVGLVGRNPGLGQQYRGSTNSRIFFASWESYFLIAEAALKGWATPMSDETAYNKGIQDSFTYNNVSGFYGQYIASTGYNRDGTSVSYGHTTEPGATHTMKYMDPNTNTLVSVNVNYPVNTIYKNGAFKNDKLTKIITQKYLANMPWLPLESWNDHRRLGLPFFENPAIENPLPNLPALNSGNYMTNQVNFFPQRLKYPSAFRNSDPKGYTQATSLLGGTDNVFTPMWWAKKQ
ncbi:susd and RagB outer membrane lipoprotein domain protein [Elizabethkingia miricola]|uniref:Susd and RagB outer membrane lipoprotein domain protein n=1 Tax=Elizabethkingia miricola TaxID=172045 RepID=A0ABD4DI79_ELIMR|nr:MULTISPECIES: SusD/RagB family nutrient-binding outer membrane lipoprotein [Elizabethkingia]KUY16894.1 susd and RagB outer membrane lipoprotein domain protein [Elizabethkingia miricola]MCL1654831.1 SusD/RagB family nutrient-binding outer membrane lipoprotein [Elizabethkingia miricola]MCL1680422.1 SusD/RagB family nutrient-binding outer membrane lipoprotein [Elizabethkingia miricola]OPC10105.1 susd and RagB outer membrane lipoprotein domain protein [Elizabethkingia miricola]OPC72556.1 susd a